MRETHAPSGYRVGGALLGATAVVLAFSRTERYRNGDAISGAMYQKMRAIWYFPREIRELVGRESGLFEPRSPGTAAWTDMQHIVDASQTPAEASVYVDVAASGVALHVLAVAVLVLLGWSILVHAAKRLDVLFATGERLRKQTRDLLPLDPTFGENVRSLVGPTWPRLGATVALVAVDAATPGRPLLVEGVFGFVVEGTRRQPGVRADLYLGEVRLLVTVTLLTVFSVVVTYLAVCATVAALRVLESRLAGWRGSVG